MSIAKDTVGVDLEDGTVAGGLKMAAGLIPSTSVGTTVQLAGEWLDADVKRGEIVSHFKRQLAGMLHVSTSEITTEVVDQHIERLPEWFKKEWNEASDIAGKTSNFFVRTAAGLAGMGLGGLMFPGLWLASVPAGFALGWLGGDLAEKEFRNAKGDVGGISSLNLSKIITHMTAEGKAPDATLTATLMLITSRPQDNTEELEAMVEQHVEGKKANPQAVTELEAYIHSEQGYLVGLLGTETQAKFPPGTQVQQIVAQYLRSSKDVDALMFAPHMFYEAIAADVSSQHIAQIQAKMQAKAYGASLMHHEDSVAYVPPVAPEAKRGEYRGA